MTRMRGIVSSYFAKGEEFPLKDIYFFKHRRIF